MKFTNQFYKLLFNGLKVISINIITFGIFLFLAEMILGFQYRKNNIASFGSIDIPRLVCGKDLEYDASKLYSSSTEVITKYTRDKDCYRSFENNGSPIALTIGGSTTDQRYVLNENTFQDVLDGLVKNKIDFVNGGVDGQSSYGHLISIKNGTQKIYLKIK